MSYGVLRRDVERLRRIQWGYLVLDEAHVIRNPHAAVAQAARSLVARHRLALTGTPLANATTELWSLFEQKHLLLLMLFFQFLFELFYIVDHFQFHRNQQLLYLIILFVLLLLQLHASL